jgi:hypothetical protein
VLDHHPHGARALSQSLDDGYQTAPVSQLIFGSRLAVMWRSL